MKPHMIRYIVRFTVGKDDECRAPCEMCRVFDTLHAAKVWHEDLLRICRQKDPSSVRQFNDAHRDAAWFVSGQSATPHPSNFGGRGWGVLSVGKIEVLSVAKEAER